MVSLSLENINRGVKGRAPGILPWVLFACHVEKVIHAHTTLLASQCLFMNAAELGATDTSHKATRKNYSAWFLRSSSLPSDDVVPSLDWSVDGA